MSFYSDPCRCHDCERRIAQDDDAGVCVECGGMNSLEPHRDANYPLGIALCDRLVRALIQPFTRSDKT